MARKKEFRHRHHDPIDQQQQQQQQQSSNKQQQKSSPERQTSPPKDRRSPRTREKPGTSNSDVYDVSDEIREQLNNLGLTLRDIPGDGNCLFRALGDQMEGNSRQHMKHRIDTVRYMIAHREHFEPFIDMPFDRYMDNLARAGTYAGQDALVAFARMHKLNIVIHQLDSPMWQIDGCNKTGNNSVCPIELHLSYHNGEHYSSVRKMGDDLAAEPAGIRIAYLTNVPCCVSNSMSTMTSPIDSILSLSTNEVPSFLQSSAASSMAICSPLQTELDPTVLVEQAMCRSGYYDEAMAGQVLAEHDYDLDQTVDYLVSLSLACNAAADDVSRSEQDVDDRPRERSPRASIFEPSPRGSIFEPFEPSQKEKNSDAGPRRWKVVTGRQKRRDGGQRPSLPAIQKKKTTVSEDNSTTGDGDGDDDDGQLPNETRFLTL